MGKELVARGANRREDVTASKGARRSLARETWACSSHQLRNNIKSGVSVMKR